MRYTIPIILLVLVSCTPSSDLQTGNQVIFRHGVASGDPLQDRVIIWTRISEETEPVRVEWQVSESKAFKKIAFTGLIDTDQSKDFTVKVDVGGLEAGKIYYYRFKAPGGYSPVGTTKTISSNADSVRFAVVSCSNYEWGYFNAYGRIAERPTLDAVIHLGDYIYEYAPGGYGDTTLQRLHEPAKEIVTLKDYRTRYAQYRTDPDLQAVHQAHPFISIWDDHEIANNSYVTGAQNHQEDEGDYQTRREAARKAYYEWMPIRENDKLYRKFEFGELGELIMLDERLEGRTVQPENMDDPQWRDEASSMLGSEQLDWFLRQLSQSKATWKVIGNQVIFSDLNQQPVFPDRPRNLDSWDGYPLEKNKIARHIKEEGLQDVIWVTGDTHASWAFEALVKEVSLVPLAVEFGTTSVNSANYDEYSNLDTAKTASALYANFNPHLKYNNLHDHGYLLLTLREEEATARYFYVETVKERSAKESLGRKLWVKKGKPFVKQFSLYE